MKKHEKKNSRNISNLSSRKAGFDRVPDELIVAILSALIPQDLLQLTQTSLLFNQRCNEDWVWKKLAQLQHEECWNIPALSSSVVFCKDVPTRGWKDYFFEYQSTWIHCALVGQNTTHSSILCIDNKIYDVTRFLPFHPGSTETLLEHAGQDASIMFQDVTHSSSATEMMKQFLIWDQSACILHGRSGTLEHVAKRLHRQQNAFIQEQVVNSSFMEHDTLLENNLVCAKCSMWYQEHSNEESSCCFHTGKKVYYYLPTGKQDAHWDYWWTCCSSSKDSLGCQYDRHEPTLIPLSHYFSSSKRRIDRNICHIM